MDRKQLIREWRKITDESIAGLKAWKGTVRRWKQAQKRAEARSLDELQAAFDQLIQSIRRWERVFEEWEKATDEAIEGLKEWKRTLRRFEREGDKPLSLDDYFRTYAQLSEAGLAGWADDNLTHGGLDGLRSDSEKERD